MKTLDLNLLLVFDTLMRTRSVTLAAAELGLHQSSLSNALTRLRAGLDDRILERHGNEMIPTRRALDVWPEVAKGLHQIDTALSTAEQFLPAASTSRFRVSLDTYALPLLGARLAARFAAAAPHAVLEIVAGGHPDASDDLTQPRLDAHVGAIWQNLGRLCSHPLISERFCLLLRRDHPVLETLPLDLETFIGLEQILPSDCGVVPGNIDAGLAKLGRKRRIAITVPSFEMAASLAAQSDLVFSCGERLATQLCRIYDLDVLPLPFDPPSFELHLVWAKRDEQAPSHLWLRQLISETCERFPEIELTVGQDQ